MVNKKGWIRIVEASIAILIIFGVLLYVSQRMAPSADDELTTTLRPLLDEIAKNVSLREEIISATDPTKIAKAENSVTAFLATRILSKSLDYRVRICGYDQVCALDKYPPNVRGNVYADGRIITSSINTLSPKKLEIFMWVRG